MSARTDRELLELAAKAAGYSIHDFYSETDAWAHIIGAELNHDGELPIFLWRPLTDDGDAMRLAVSLCMGVQSNGIDHWQSPNCTIVLFGAASRLTQKHNGDAIAATRRAIVRAGAEIGASA